MDNFHLNVIAVALYFHLPGSVGTNSEWSLLHAHHRSGCRWDGDFSVNCSFTGISAIPEDLSQTAITADFSFNNITTFTCAEERSEEWMLKHLNLSNNLISELSLTTCRNLPLLETLNLDGNAIHAFALDLPTPQKDGNIDHLLPALKVLSVERNNLSSVPRGLGLLQSLETLRLSSNGIRQVGPTDFENCSQLQDIDLQNNKITEIHLDAFRDLNKLQVVDLRENALATPLPQTLISLNFFQLEVGLSNNAWIFNCRPNAFKHLFHFRFDSTRKKWSISYNVSATNSQKPLLYLSSFHLNCSDGVLLRRTVIPTGRTSVLNCDLDNTRGNGVSWWTPKGRISKDKSVPHMALDRMNNLMIHNAERPAEGLYVCTSNTTKRKYLTYSIQVKERVSGVLVQSARDATAVFRRGGGEQDLALAVSLSVLITFVCAFCLGALARPYLGRLWRLMRRNKNSGSEHTYDNHGFSDETSSRGSSASKPPNTQHDLFTSQENSSRKTRFFPTEASALYENVIGSSVQAPNTEEEHQEQSNNENTVISDIKPSISSYEDTTAGDNGLSSGRSQDHKNSNEAAQSEITKATPDSPERKGIFSHKEPLSTTKFLPGRQRCDEQLGLNGNTNTTSDVGDFVSPSSCKRDPSTENLHLQQTTENSPLKEYDYKTAHTSDRYAPADIFGDSSSDEGTPFTLSDCSSLSDLELEQPDAGDTLPVCQSSLEEANGRSGTEKFSAPTESPTLAAELQCIGENEDESNANFETTVNYGSDTILPETASPWADGGSDHVSISGSDTRSSSSQEGPATFDYFTDAEPTGQTPDSLHNQSTDFGSTFLSLHHSPTCDADTEKVPEEAEVQLYQLPVEPERSLSSTPPAHKEDGSEGSGEEDAEWTPSEENHGEGDVTFRRTTSIFEDSDLIFAPLDTGLNEIVKNTSPLHSSDESSLQSLPEHTAENHLLGVAEEDDLLPWEKEENTTEACAEEMQTGLSEENCDGFTESQDTSNCSLPEETPPGNLRADLLHLHSSGKTQPGFNTEDNFQLDQREEAADSLSVPQGSFHESTGYSSWSFPGNTIFRSTDSSRREDDTTWTGLESSSTAATSPQNSSEQLSQKSQTNSGQGQFFVKKKRAFDGFANILQSRKTDFNS
ncbi:PREDICTED: leucine-rich repeat-containing protein 66 [Calidris pugnax]|uniref:leucine-rich repeat-containing protein 66 n=1 Tax=Calidris pugnax TaxID=198806 RepID=UPI00071C7DA1|nr:PREDICTED: leucine-rich repeat-containing protein 66 [Calidris pugnax]